MRSGRCAVRIEQILLTCCALAGLSTVTRAQRDAAQAASCDSPAAAASGRVRIDGLVDDGSNRWPSGLTVSLADSPGVRADAVNPAGSTPAADRTSPVDADGRFHLCVAASDSVLPVVLRLGAVSLADTLLPAARSERTTILSWRLPKGLFVRAQQNDGSVLSGRVLDQGAGVPEVEVTLPAIRTSMRTNAAGRFRFIGLSAGPQTIEVRRVGRAPERDTVTLQPHQETVRDLVLGGTVAHLEAVQTTAKQTSPVLQEFENRRTHAIGGHFLTDSVLRANDRVAMGNFLRAHIPGLRIIHYRMSEYLASRRTGGAHDLPLNAADRRSPKACFPQIYLDGLRIYDGPPPPPPISDFAVYNYSAVEFYSGGATMPLQFRSLNNPCGALLLWRRQR